MLVAWNPSDVLQSRGGAALHGIAWDPVILTSSTVYISQIHVPVRSRSTSAGMMADTIRSVTLQFGFSLKIPITHILLSLLRSSSFGRCAPVLPTRQCETTKSSIIKRTHVANFSSSLVSSPGFPACRTPGQSNQWLFFPLPSFFVLHSGARQNFFGKGVHIFHLVNRGICLGKQLRNVLPVNFSSEATGTMCMRKD